MLQEFIIIGRVGKPTSGDGSRSFVLMSLATCTSSILHIRYAAAMPFIRGDPIFRSRQHSSLDSDGFRLSELTLGTHLGTHVDAPSHYLTNGATTEQLALETLVGPAMVVDVPSSAGALIEPTDLEPHAEAIAERGRVLLRTGWSNHFGSERFFKDHPGLTPDAARWLVARGARLIGLDLPSPSLADCKAVHEILLSASPPVVIVESLANLDQLPSKFTLAVLPLKLVGLDGSPSRVIAMVDGG